MTNDKNTMNSSCPELILGRNQTTLISHHGISRSAATITCNYDETSSIFEFRMSAYRSRMVSINGRSPSKGNSDHGGGGKKRRSCVVIKMGDIISLHDREGEKQYRYRVDVLNPLHSGENASEDADKKPPSKVSVKEDSSVVSAESTIADCATAQSKPHDSAVEDEGRLKQAEGLMTKALRALYSQKSSCTNSSIGSKIAHAPGIEEDPTATLNIKEDHTATLKHSPILKHSAIKLDPDSKDFTTRGTEIPHTEEDTRATIATNTTSTTSSTTPPHPPTPTPEEIHLQKINKTELERQERLERQRNRRVLAIERLQSTARQHTLDELTCSICMEILVRTHVAHPCGHLFCGPCIERMTTFRYNEGVFLAFQPPPSIVKLKSCPTCRVDITSCVLARSYDNVIWNMVLMGTVFQGKEAEDDLKQFLVRSGREIEKLT